MGYRQVSMTQVKMEKEGAVLEGVIKSIDLESPTAEGKTRCCVTVEKANEKTGKTEGFFAFLGVSAKKDLAMRSIGEKVRITYLGKEQSTAGRGVKTYRFEVDDERAS